MNNCGNCNNCKKIYRKYAYEYHREKTDYCTVKEEITQADSVCVSWRKKQREYDLSPLRFDEAVNDLKIIDKITKARPQ